jgi:hypothetical protein
VGFAVQRLVALLNGGLTDGLCQVAFPGAAGAEKQRVLALVDEGTGGEIEDQAAIHLRIESEVEVIECPVGIAKAGLLLWCEQNVDLGAKFPLLAMYLGHVGLASSHRYLQLTQDLTAS